MRVEHSDQLSHLSVFEFLIFLIHNEALEIRVHFVQHLQISTDLSMLTQNTLYHILVKTGCRYQVYPVAIIFLTDSFVDVRFFNHRNLMKPERDILAYKRV